MHVHVDGYITLRNYKLKILIYWCTHNLAMTLKGVPSLSLLQILIVKAGAVLVAVISLSMFLVSTVATVARV